MADEPSPVRYWHDLTTREARELAARDPVVVLPIAAVEQHGPHLPLSTDVVIGEGILAAAFTALSDDVPLLALPTQAVATSVEHEDFAGTVSLPARTLEDVVFAIGASLARAGVRRLVVSNSHGGNRAVVDTAGLRLRREHGLLVVKAHYFRFPRPPRPTLPESEWSHGLHGGAVETAMMMHLRPDLVRGRAIGDFASLGRELEERLTHLRPEGSASFSWTAQDLNPDGAVGDATLADAAMGARFVEHYGARLADVVRDTRRFPLDRLDSK